MFMQYLQVFASTLGGVSCKQRNSDRITVTVSVITTITESRDLEVPPLGPRLEQRDHYVANDMLNDRKQPELRTSMVPWQCSPNCESYSCCERGLSKNC